MAFTKLHIASSLAENFEKISKSIDKLSVSIKALESDTTPFQTYGFPIITIVVSVFLSAGIAYTVSQRKELAKVERTKLDTINKWLLLASQAQAELFAIKQNYARKLTSNPIQRIAECMNPQVGHNATLDYDISTLTFLVHGTQEDVIKDKWRQPYRIASMVQNFESVIHIWRQCGERKLLMAEAIKASGNIPNLNELTYTDIIQILGKLELAASSSLLEMAIKLTDELIVELADFLDRFPTTVRPLLNKRLIKNYGGVITHMPSPSAAQLIDKVPEVDWNIMSYLFEEPVEVVKARFETGYERRS